MLIFNPHPMFRRRGIDKPHRALVKAGISAATATKILNTHSLCRLLNCTPNELFIWRPDKNEAANDNLALKALAADTSKQNISEIVKTAPLEKLTQIEKILSEL
jgi:DNA-binding Xre family transcriptional regulator